MPRWPTKPCDGRVLSPNAMPLDYMLSVIRDPKAPDERRERMAALAAPYCHEKVMYNRPTKKDTKARAASQAGDGTAWAGLLNGTPAVPTGKSAS
jgi:hypothetical protein